MFVGNHEGHGDLGVVLVQGFIYALVIEHVRLVLPQAVKGLVVRRFEYLLQGIGRLPVHRDGRETFTTPHFLQQNGTVGVGEQDFARFGRNLSLYFRGFQDECIALFHQIPADLFRLVGTHQTGFGGEALRG